MYIRPVDLMVFEYIATPEQNKKTTRYYLFQDTMIARDEPSHPLAGHFVILMDYKLTARYDTGLPSEETFWSSTQYERFDLLIESRLRKETNVLVEPAIDWLYFVINLLLQKQDND